REEPDRRVVPCLRGAEFDKHQQIVPARQDFCFVAMALHQAQRLFERLRRDVFERRGNHFALLLPFCMSFQIRSRLNGMSTCRTPNGERASATALSSAGVAPMVPASPTPLTPRGFTGEGVTVRPVSINGISDARGIA